MGRLEDRTSIVSGINAAARLYRANLVGRSFMYVFDGRYIEVLFKKSNFRHLTGVDTDLSALAFYKLASQGKLAASQIGFSSRHPFGLCKKKVAHIAQLADLTTGDCFILEDVSTKTQSFKFGATDLDFSLLFNKRGGGYAAESLRDEDCFSKSKNVFEVSCILAKRNDERFYQELLYSSSSFHVGNLPGEVQVLLGDNLKRRD